MSAAADVYSIVHKSKHRAAGRLSAIQKLLPVPTDGDSPVQVYCDVGCGDATISTTIAAYVRSTINYYADVHLPADALNQNNDTVEQDVPIGTHSSASGTPETNECVLHEHTESKCSTTYIQIDETKCTLDVVPDTTVNLITCFMSMHHFRNLHQMMNECNRIAATNCVMIIREHDAHESVIPYLDFVHLIYLAQKNLPHNEFYAGYFTKRELRQTLEAYGWRYVNEYIQTNETGKTQQIYYSMYTRANTPTTWCEPKPTSCTHRLEHGNLCRYIFNLRDKTLYIKFLKHHGYTELQAMQLLQHTNIDLFVAALQKVKLI